MLPSAGRPAAIAFNMQLTSHQAQQVRVIVVAAATGAVLVDKKYGLTAGHLTTLQLELPSSALATAATGKDRQVGGGLQPVAPLRLIITTPTHHTQGPQPPQLARLLATATLLAAPASLASELCGLHELMEQQGAAQQLTAQEVWSQHWQVLMNDLALCLMAADDLSSATPGEGTAVSAYQVQAVGEVAETLCQFFLGHVMPGWQAQMHSSLQALSHQQAQGQQALLWEQGVVATPFHRDEPAGPATPQVGKQATSTSVPAPGGHDDSQQPAKPGLAPAAGTSSGKGAASREQGLHQPEAPPAHLCGLSFKDKAQELRYRDWAMKRACVPIIVW
jgi:hypothetical protein